jgi:hypothetical protein
MYQDSEYPNLFTTIAFTPDLFYDNLEPKLAFYNTLKTVNIMTLISVLDLDSLILL